MNVLIFDSDVLPASDRAEALHVALTGTETPQNVTFGTDGPIHHRMEIFDFGPGVSHGNGFASASHFTKRFRQVCGTTPDEWRRISREGR